MMESKRSILRKVASFLVVAALALTTMGVPTFAQFAPAAPSALVVVTVNAGQANLTWTDNSTDETEFRIERADDEEFDTAVEFVVAADVTSYTDFTTVGLHTYFYRVFAINADGSSPPSNEVRVFTPASSPTVAIETPAGSPAVFQSGLVNTISVSATGVGAAIASVEYQLLLNDAPGTFTAQDIATEPDQTPFVIPTPIFPGPANDSTVVAELPAGAIVEVQIFGRIAAVNPGGEWIIGTGSPTFTVYESSATEFQGSRVPVAGDAIWVVAHRTPGPGPLVAEQITFRAPAPQPVGPAAYKLAALYKGVVQSVETAYTTPGVSYGGTTWTVGGVPFRVDNPAHPAFTALVDEGLRVGNAVEVRFWVSTPTTSLPVARQVFPQAQTLDLPPLNSTPVFNYDPVPMGLPPGTRLQFMIVGVITAQDLNTKTWQLGDPQDPILVYGHSLTLPLSDAFRVVPDIGDEVIVTGRRTIAPGPLVADQILILADGPAPAFELGETRTEVLFLYNGSVIDTGAANGGSTWTVSISGIQQEFIMNDADEPAVIDTGPLQSVGLGSPVTVEFLPPTQVLPEDNWAPLTFDTGANRWTTSVDLPAAPISQTGILFVRTTDIAAQGSSVAVPAQLLTGTQNQAPIAVNDSYAATGTQPLVVAVPGVLTNDTDADGPSPLTAQLVSGPAGATVTLDANGSFTFTNVTNPSVASPVTFTYQAFDDNALSNVATVTVTVNPDATANRPPIAVDDNVVITAKKKGSTTINVLQNDVDPEGKLDKKSLVIVTPPPAGSGDTATVKNGAIEFKFNGPGTTTFTYTVKDDRGATSNVATVTVIVLAGAQNQAQTAADDSYTATGTQPLVVAALGVLTNDTDADDPSLLTAQLVAGPTGATVTLDANGAFTFTNGTNPSVPTPVTFTYQAFDGDALSNVATVTVTVNPDAAANIPPLAVDDNVVITAMKKGSETINVVQNDVDPEGKLDKKSVVIVTPPPAGSGDTATVKGGGIEFSYDGPGTTTFTYTVNDDSGATSNVATVTVIIQ